MEKTKEDEIKIVFTQGNETLFHLSLLPGAIIGLVKAIGTLFGGNEKKS